MMNRLFRGLATAGLVAMLVACSGRGGDDRYLTEEVVRGDIENTVLGTGVLQPLLVVDVGAQASGQIQSLNVEVGDLVSRGELIAVIDPATQQNTLNNAEASLIQARAQLESQQATMERAQLELDRQEALVEQGYTSRAAYDRARADLKVAQAQEQAVLAQIRQAEIRVEEARVDLSRTNITAPISGVVASIVAREGQTVNAVQSAPTIVRIAQLDQMTVRAQISEADVIGLRSGQEVYFTVLGDPDNRFYGSLRAIEPAPENANQNLVGQPNAPVYYSAVFDVPNPEGVLKSGMTAEVSIIIDDAESVLVMPSAGLGERNEDGTYPVRVLGDDGEVEIRNVRVGVNNNSEAQVLDGLEEGDEVVIGDSWDATISGLPQPDQNGN